MYRPAVIPYWHSKRMQDFESIGAERNLAGMPIMEVPPDLLSPNANPEDQALRAELEKFVTAVRMDQRWGGLVPSEYNEDGTASQYRFKLVQNSGRSAIDTDVVIRRHESRMMMLFLAQFLMLGMEGHGSFSLSSNMTSLFGTAIGTIMDQIASVINLDLIPRRQRMNGIDPALTPVLMHGDIEGPVLKEVGDYVQKLASSGMITPTPALERRLMEIGNLPQPEEDDVDFDLPEDVIDAVAGADADKDEKDVPDPDTES